MNIYKIKVIRRDDQSIYVILNDKGLYSRNKSIIDKSKMINQKLMINKKYINNKKDNK